MLTQSLPQISQVSDPHTNEYLERLRDEPIFMALTKTVADYLNRIEDHAAMGRVLYRLAEHCYHKTQPVYGRIRNEIVTASIRTAEENAAAAAAVADGEGTQGAAVEGEGEGEAEKEVVLKVPEGLTLWEDV